MSEAPNTPAAPQQPATTSAVAEAPAAPAGIAPTPPEPATVPPEAPDATEQVKAGREAAKYRVQLRTAEGERDALAATLETLRRGIVEQNMPNGSKTNAEALWTNGHQSSEFFNEDQTLNTEALYAAAKGAHEKLGLRFNLPDPVPSSGTGGGYVSDGATWSQAVKGN